MGRPRGRSKEAEDMDDRIIKLLKKGKMRKKEVAEHLDVPIHRVYRISQNNYNKFPSRAENILMPYEQQVLRKEVEADDSARTQQVCKIAELLEENKLAMNEIAATVDAGYPLVKAVCEFLKENLGYIRERKVLSGVRKRTNSRGLSREWLIHHRFEKGMTLNEIGEILGITRERVRQILKKEGLDGRISLLDRWYEENTVEETPIDVSYFDDIQREDQAYWLGYLIAKSRLRYNPTGQGTISLSLNQEEVPHFSRLMNLLDCEVEFEEKPNPNKYTHSVEIFSQELLDVLLKHGGKIFRSGVGFSPSQHIPEHLFPHYIRAVWEVKSYFTELKQVHKEGIYFLYASEEFLQFYADFMRAHGAAYAEKSIRSLDRGRYQIMTTSIEVIYNIYQILYADASIALPSKLAEAQAFIQKHKRKLEERALPKPVRPKRPRKKRPFNMRRRDILTPFNETYLQDIDTEEKAYWVGFLLNSLTLSSNKSGVPVIVSNFVEDKAPHRRRFFSAIESDPSVGITSPTKANNDKKYYQVKIVSPVFAKQAEKLGLLRGEWEDQVFPHWLDDKLIPHFLRGYYESRGFITTNGKHLKVVFGGGQDFLEAVVAWLRTQDVSIPKKAIQKREHARKQVRLSIQGEKLSQKFALALYGNATFYNEEKANEFNQFFGGGES